MENAKAVDVRYNLTIIGGKYDSDKYIRSSVKEVIKGNQHEDSDEIDRLVKQTLSNCGCPHSLNPANDSKPHEDREFVSGCDYGNGDCRDCWQQRPFEWKQWEDDN